MIFIRYCTEMKKLRFLSRLKIGSLIILIFLNLFHQDKIIYGINTGLGPMAQYRIDEADRINLQYNAIRSHASGCGEPVDKLLCTFGPYCAV